LRRGTLSHDTALDLHELCDINPAQIHITIPTAYRLQKPVPKQKKPRSWRVI
jgi:predicted transcriptional regulator of viral defense system